MVRQQQPQQPLRRLVHLVPRAASPSLQLQQQQTLQLPQLPFAVRYKQHSAKMGKHLQNLDEMAHETSRQEAQERRKKKKEKKAAKKNKKGGAAEPAAETAKFSMESAVADDDFMENDDDDDHDDEEDHPEDVLPDPAVVKERLMNLVTKYAESLKAIRGAEPTPELFEDVMVSAYGASTPLKSVAQVVIASPTLASATCFDPAVSKDVAAALQEKLGLNPSVEEGGVVRIPIPRVSQESRQKTAAALAKRTEACRTRLRNTRRKVLGIVKQGVAGKLEGISKDDAFRVQQEIENVVEASMKELNRIADEKHDSIMVV